MKKNPDLEWEKWGQKDPYFAVITLEKFRNSHIDDEAKAEFFETGRNHVRHILGVCRQKIDPLFNPKKIIDFGCGTGRLVVPFAETAEQVVGIDISDSMLTETRANCDNFGLNNVKLIKSDDSLSLLDGSYDLIHSFTVFQHIPVERGINMLKELLSHLNYGGICAAHFTFAKKNVNQVDVSSSQGTTVQPMREKCCWDILRYDEKRHFDPKSLLNRSYMFYLKAKLSAGFNLSPLQQRALTEFLDHQTARSIGSKEQNNDPEMQMNSYDMNQLLLVVRSVGVNNAYIEYSDHDGDQGVLLYFQKTDKLSNL